MMSWSTKLRHFGTNHHSRLVPGLTHVKLVTPFTMRYTIFFLVALVPLALATGSAP
jgi:hypothetical protein